MSEKVNLKRARVIEFTSLHTGQTLLGVRANAYRFHIVAINGVPTGVEDRSAWPEHEVQQSGKNITVLAEFPVTLADLIPEGCEAFRFKRRYNVEFTATRGTGEQADVWTINGMHGLWRDLNKLSDDLGVCLDTVVPLELRVHPQHVEERR